VSDVVIGTGKVVVNRAMSLDGSIAGPGHAMDWIAEYLPADAFPEVMAATGAMLIGRGTYEVAKRMADQDTAYDGGAQFVLTHKPPDEPDPTVTFLTCGLEEAVATARSAAGGKNLEILRCRRGRPVPAARARRRDPGVCPTGATGRRRPLLAPRPRPDRPGTFQQHPVGRCSASVCESRGPRAASLSDASSRPRNTSGGPTEQGAVVPLDHLDACSHDAGPARTRFVWCVLVVLELALLGVGDSIGGTEGRGAPAIRNPGPQSRDRG